MYAGTRFTDPGRMESWVNFSGKEGHSNIQLSTRPGIESGTSELGGRDLTTAPTPPLLFLLHYSDWVCTAVMSNEVMKDLRG